MISRVAEHCFWMSRYLERLENTARVLDVNQTLLLDFQVPLEQQWKPILIISGIHTMPCAPDAESIQQYMTWEIENPCSIASSLAACRENARVIREVISADMWERLNHYYLWMRGDSCRNLYDRSRSEFYNDVRRINQTFHGITDGTMSHGEAWEFIQLGRNLERASQTTRILDVKYHMLLPSPQHLGTPVENAHWAAILMSCSAYEPFHKQHNGTDLGLAVPGFLIFDPLFPRSVRRCLIECQGAVHAISGRPISAPVNEGERAIHALVSWLHLTNASDFVHAGLHEALTNVVNNIHDIGEAIRRTYFDARVEQLVESQPVSAAS
jgi:uncharacterized alpha-E superfamily protein